MARKVTLYTAQFGDMPLEQICAKAKAFPSWTAIMKWVCALHLRYTPQK